MSVEFRVRLATQADNEALIALVRRCPVEGSMQLILDRYPDYFALSRLQGEEARIFVAETPAGEIIGSAALIARQEYWREQAYSVLRFSDVRTDPRHRKSRIAAAFIELYRQELLSGRFDYGTTEILEGNRAPLTAHHLLGPDFEVEEDGFVHVYQLLPLWSYRQPGAYRIRKAGQDDLPALSRLLQQNFASSHGHPTFAANWLQEVLAQHPSFSLEQFYLTEDAEGQLLAAVASWDQKSLRQMICLRFDRAARWMVRILTLLGLLWRLPPVPQTGRPLRYLYLRWPAARPGAEEALKSLLRHVMNDMRRHGEYQFAAIGFHEGDDQRYCLDGLVKVKSRMHIFRHRLRTPLPNRVAEAPGGLPFADPALL